MNALVEFAKEWATRWHALQTRRGGEPYVEHLRRVAEAVAKRGYGPEHQAVAWLHDAVEDGQVTQEGIAQRFPASVAEAVKAITKNPGEKYEDYLIRVKANPLAHEVKISDMLDNLGDSPTVDARARYEIGLEFLLT